MRSKIVFRGQSEKLFNEVFEDFIISQTARGISDITIRNYRQHLHSISKHLDISTPFEDLSKRQLDEMILSMRANGLAHNSIATYVRMLHTFFNWCNREGISDLNISSIREKETIKETYSDEELERLLKRPGKEAEFGEFRCWVIVNFFMNCGCRAATVRNIQNRDVDLKGRQIIFRHNKNGKIQVVPLCSRMVLILSDYMAVRKGKPEDYLFCNQYGEMLTENALSLAIKRYNKKRGVKKTSMHLFRHTFARKYLVDCGGDAFMLQRLLGHSTLNMTKHYCSIFDADISKNYDRISPLEQLTKPKETIKR